MTNTTMSDRTVALQGKTMSRLEQQLLKIAGEELTTVKVGGVTALAYLLDMVASWHGSRAQIGFHDFAQRWLIEGNARNKAADQLLRDLFGLNEPTPRKAA